MLFNDENTIFQSIIQNMRDFFKEAILLSHHQKAGIQSFHDSMRYYSGSDFALFNGLFHQGDFDSREYFSDLIHYFSGKNKPFVWWWLSSNDIPSDIQISLDHHGFQGLGMYNCLALDLKNIELQEANNKIEIVKINDAKEYKHYIDIISEVFQVSDSVRNDFFVMLNSYGDDKLFQHYLGYYENKPVTVLTSYIKDKVAGLYSGATLPGFQKLGLCTTIGQYALTDAKKSGCELAVTQLMAPGMAQGICEKIGFKSYGRMLPYVFNKLN